MKTVSVVVPTYNRPALLRRLLQSLPGAGAIAEVVVVDDGTPGEGPRSIAEAAGATYLRQHRRGPAAARNLGWRSSSGEAVVFVDDDCVVEPGAIDSLSRSLESADAVGAVIRPIGSESLVAAFMQAEHLVDHKVVDGEVQWLVTACAAFTREALVVTDGFDERFSNAGGEDADLSFRLRQLGFRLAVDRNAVVLHEHRAGITKLVRTYYRHGTAQRLLVEKHPDRPAQLARSARDRLSVQRWVETYHDYRRDVPPVRSVAYLCLRGAMMVPWLIGAARATSAPR